MKPIKYTRFVTTFYTTILLLPAIEIVYTLIVEAENVKESFYHYHSPGFTYNIYLKWIYSIIDLSADLLMNFFMIYEHACV